MLPLAVIGALSISALGLWALRSQDAAEAAPLPSPIAPAPVEAPKPKPPAPIQVAELEKAQKGADGHLVLQRQAEPRPTTLRSDLQDGVEAYLARTGLAYGAVVMIDPQTGHVLAMAETRDPSDPVGAIGRLTEPTVPAASVIKVVTAAALLENGATPETTACFHGGMHGLDGSHLVERPSDRRCETLTMALARSSNAAFARFALRDLPDGALLKTAEAFGFNRGIASDVAVVPSHFSDAGAKLDRARAAAGFSGSTLSPLHAAWLAAVVASDGRVERISAWRDNTSNAGLLVDPAKAPPAIRPETAAALRQMMVQTTVAGTGSKAFGARPKSLRGMEIGGKTGSLSAPEGELFRHVSWFIGFAPAENPKVAVAALAINGWKWKVKAPALARDAMGLYFDQAGKQTAGAAPSPGEMRAPALAVGTAATVRGAELSLLPLDGGPGSL
jgi:cell division protein FtsI/penicillin-binding protein 2